MFKVLEVHSAYISSALTIIVHLLVGFYLLYILKTSYGDSLAGGPEKRVVWYKAPSTQPPTVPQQTVYEQPVPESVAAQSPEYAELPFQESVAPSTVPPDASPLRKGRSPEERRASWTKKSAAPVEEKDMPLTAAGIVNAISREQALKRHAHAVYTKEQAINQGVAAQMREITDGRLRNKIFSALKIACSLHTKEYYSPVPIDTTIVTSLVLNEKGVIVAVEVLKSTGTPSLDEHIAYLLQSIQKIALPPSKTGQDFYTQTFTCRVRCPAGSGHFEFSYNEGSGIHIM